MEKSRSDKFFLTIITVVYNGKNALVSTIDSVIPLKAHNIQYIVIDGGSNDGTTDTIRKYEKYIDYWVSEPDNGVYDAMNKGLRLAASNYVYFLNAADIVYKDSLLKLLPKLSSGKFDVIYCDILNSTTKLIQKGLQKEVMEIELPFCHQAAVVKTKLAKETKFDTKYKIAADYAFFKILYTKGYSFKYINLLLGEIDGEGLSNTLFKKTIFEYINIHWRTNGKSAGVRSVFYYIYHKRRFIIYLIINSLRVKS